MYTYKILVQWKEGQKVSLSDSHEVRTDLDFDKVNRILRECLMHVKCVLEVVDE